MALNESDFTGQEWSAIALCRAYVKTGPFGFPGHLLMVLVNKLANLADQPESKQTEYSLWRVRVGGRFSWNDTKYYVVRAETRGEAAAKVRESVGRATEIASIRLLPDQDVIHIETD